MFLVVCVLSLTIGKVHHFDFIRQVGDIREVPVGEPTSDGVELGEAFLPSLLRHRLGTVVCQSGSSHILNRNPSRLAICGAWNTILLTWNGVSSSITPASTSPSIAALTAG